VCVRVTLQMHADANIDECGNPRGTGPGEAIRAVAENIETIVRLEEAALREHTPADRLTGAIARFVGSVKFIGLQLLALGVWIAINLGLIPLFRPSILIHFPYSAAVSRSRACYCRRWC